MHTSVGVGSATRREFVLDGHADSVGEGRRRVLEVAEEFIDETTTSLSRSPTRGQG